MRCRLPLLVLFSLFLISALCQSQSGAGRQKYNSDWKALVGDPQGADQLGFDDSPWKRVTTPYAWNEDSAFRVSIHDLPTSAAVSIMK